VMWPSQSAAIWNRPVASIVATRPMQSTVSIATRRDQAIGAGGVGVGLGAAVGGGSLGAGETGRLGDGLAGALGEGDPGAAGAVHATRVMRRIERTRAGRDILVDSVHSGGQFTASTSRRPWRLPWSATDVQN
jgi:hypothetical protein